jgi:hypothetical protein
VLVAEQRAQPLLVLANSAVMGARMELPQAAVNVLEPGQATTVVVGGRSYNARISSLTLSPDTAGAQARYSVVASFSVSPEDGLRAGQKARVRLP